MDMLEQLEQMKTLLELETSDRLAAEQKRDVALEQLSSEVQASSDLQVELDSLLKENDELRGANKAHEERLAEADLTTTALLEELESERHKCAAHQQRVQQLEADSESLRRAAKEHESTAVAATARTEALTAQLAESESSLDDLRLLFAQQQKGAATTATDTQARRDEELRERERAQQQLSEKLAQMTKSNALVCFDSFSMKVVFSADYPLLKFPVFFVRLAP